MSDEQRQDLLRSLAAYGADLSRWPAGRAEGARRTILAHADVRRAFDEARALDGALTRARDDLDRTIAASGAANRVARRIAARASYPFAGFRWQRIAAAMLVAGMLGGALDLVMPDPADPLDLVMLDPLSAEDAELR
jgi:hypothetical protein